MSSRVIKGKGGRRVVRGTLQGLVGLQLKTQASHRHPHCQQACLLVAKGTSLQLPRAQRMTSGLTSGDKRATLHCLCYMTLGGAFGKGCPCTT
jgi:hypothetical protein